MPLKQVLIRRGLPIVADVPAPQVSDNTILVEVAFSLISTGTESANLSSGGKSVLQQAYQEPAKIVRGLQLVQQVGVRRAMEIVNGELDAAHAAGYSCSGTVVACGRRVVGFAPGDRVACAGANKANHAEIVAVPQNLAVRLPEGCDLESAASAMAPLRKTSFRKRSIVPWRTLGGTSGVVCRSPRGSTASRATSSRRGTGMSPPFGWTKPTTSTTTASGQSNRC